VSYARLGPDSDVYVVNGGRALECTWCRLGNEQKDFTSEEMIAHLTEHVAAGHKVPWEAFERLRREVASDEYRRVRSAPRSYLIELDQDPADAGGRDPDRGNDEPA